MTVVPPDIGKEIEEMKKRVYALEQTKTDFADEFTTEMVASWHQTTDPGSTINSLISTPWTPYHDVVVTSIKIEIEQPANVDTVWDLLRGTNLEVVASCTVVANTTSASIAVDGAAFNPTTPMYFRLSPTSTASTNSWGEVTAHAYLKAYTRTFFSGGVDFSISQTQLPPPPGGIGWVVTPPGTGLPSGTPWTTAGTYHLGDPASSITENDWWLFDDGTAGGSPYPAIGTSTTDTTALCRGLPAAAPGNAYKLTATLATFVFAAGGWFGLCFEKDLPHGLTYPLLSWGGNEISGNARWNNGTLNPFTSGGNGLYSIDWDRGTSAVQMTNSWGQQVDSFTIPNPPGKPVAAVFAGFGGGGSGNLTIDCT